MNNTAGAIEPIGAGAEVIEEEEAVKFGIEVAVRVDSARGRLFGRIYVIQSTM